MRTETFILHGVVPAKKNSRICARAGMRIVNIPSADFSAWHRRNLPSVIAQRQGDNRPHVLARLSIVLRYTDRRRRDIDNAVSSILDLLVDAHVLKDDCWTCVPEISARAELVETKGVQAHAEVSIEDLA